MQHFLKDLTIMLSGMAFHAADTHRATSEGAARKGRLKERCGLEPRTKFLFRLRNRQKLVRIRFGCGLDSRIYGINIWSLNEEWLLNNETVAVAPDFDRAPLCSHSFHYLKYIRRTDG
jgi:hypothetical protein